MIFRKKKIFLEIFALVEPMFSMGICYSCGLCRAKKLVVL